MGSNPNTLVSSPTPTRPGTKQLPCKDRSKEEGGREAAVVVVAAVAVGSRHLKVTLIMVNQINE
jgi:hypothetical protein